MSTLTNPISKKLHTIKLSALVEGQKTVSVKATDALYAVVKVLHENKLHSAPVLDANGVCVGVIDMLDIAAYAITVAPDQKDLVSWSRWEPAANPKLALETAGRALTMVPASAVMNKSNKDNYVPLEMDSVATLAVDVFASGVHRSPILDKDGKVVGTLSQSALVKWLIAESKTYFKNLDALDLYLNDLGLGGSALVTVKEDWSVVKVLTVLAAAGVSAVPVVNKAGKLVANFSAVDLVGLYNDNLPKFSQPILAYLKEHAPHTLVTEGLTYRDTKLKDLLNYFEANQHHRVWIVDEGRPTGVVSHTDILAFMRDYSGN